jgi:hypothetical protein
VLVLYNSCSWCTHRKRGQIHCQIKSALTPREFATEKIYPPQTPWTRLSLFILFFLPAQIWTTREALVFSKLLEAPDLALQEEQWQTPYRTSEKSDWGPVSPSSEHVVVLRIAISLSPSQCHVGGSCWPRGLLLSETLNSVHTMSSPRAWLYRNLVNRPQRPGTISATGLE